jgi:hypothetical protein
MSQHVSSSDSESEFEDHIPTDTDDDNDDDDVECTLCCGLLKKRWGALYTVGKNGITMAALGTQRMLISFVAIAKNKPGRGMSCNSIAVTLSLS